MPLEFQTMAHIDAFQHIPCHYSDERNQDDIRTSKRTQEQSAEIVRNTRQKQIRRVPKTEIMEENVHGVEFLPRANSRKT